MRHPIRAELAVMSNVGLLKARPWYLMLAEEEAAAGQNGCRGTPSGCQQVDVRTVVIALTQ
jgi:hypothetical protein